MLSFRTLIRSCIPVPTNRSRAIDNASRGSPFAVPFRR